MATKKMYDGLTVYTSKFLVVAASLFISLFGATAMAQEIPIPEGYELVESYCPNPAGCTEWVVVEEEPVVETAPTTTTNRGATFHIGGFTHFGHQTLLGASAGIEFPLQLWNAELGVAIGTNVDTMVHAEYFRFVSPTIGNTGLQFGPEIRSVVDEGPLGNGNTQIGVYVGGFARWNFGPRDAFALEGFVGGGPGFTTAAPDTLLDRKIGSVAGGGLGFTIDLVDLF